MGLVLTKNLLQARSSGLIWTFLPIFPEPIIDFDLQHALMLITSTIFPLIKASDSFNLNLQT